MTAIQSQISSRALGNGIVITLMTPQLLEDAEIASLEKLLMEKINNSNIANFVLNFENVTFLSSAVLRVLIRVNNTITERKGMLRLCCINPNIFEVFKITKLSKIFEIHKDLDRALDSLK